MTGKQIVVLVVGAIIGIAGLRYVGLLVLIPALSVAACWWIFTRLGLHPRLVLPLAVAGGHGIWFFIGTVMALAAGGGAQTLIEVGLETAIVLAIVAWGCVSRSRPALGVLIAYEIVSIGFNAMAWSGAGDLRPILAVHIGLRIVAIIGAALALGRWLEIAPSQ
ncbi:hypothetical protein [Reyranella soli]|jgi:hypothetical protein|uniref:Uncharacterized protein n=1 Tax=Reyranella soli TaxID=1230389 RepID=A0A512N2K2_9HYPH|nr:hypothetical protein [Reyranella soli]GEP53214.1 hypothetical protein RSO01_03800 [Reyranella soli]